MAVTKLSAAEKISLASAVETLTKAVKSYTYPTEDPDALLTSVKDATNAMPAGPVKSSFEKIVQARVAFGVGTQEKWTEFRQFSNQVETAIEAAKQLLKD